MLTSLRELDSHQSTSLVGDTFTLYALQRRTFRAGSILKTFYLTKIRMWDWDITVGIG